jgi:hypothetical protein
MPGNADTLVRQSKLLTHGYGELQQKLVRGLGFDNDREDKIGWRTRVSAIPG